MADNQVSQPEKKLKRGELIAVCSAKGGIGRTTLTVNLAVALYKKNIKVGIIDGDFQFGDVSLAMDLHPTFTIKEVIESIETLDEYSLASYLCSHESGVRVLPAPERPEFADLVTNGNLDKLLDLMLVQHDFVVADTGVGLDEQTIYFMERADQILIIVNLEMAALKNTKLMLETLNILGLHHKVRIIINRSDMESVIKAGDAAKILGEEDPIFIPNDFQVSSQALNIGIPFVVNQGKTEIARAVFKMAELITSRREIAMFKHTTKGPSLFQKWFKGKKMKGGADE